MVRKKCECRDGEPQGGAPALAITLGAAPLRLPLGCECGLRSVRLPLPRGAAFNRHTVMGRCYSPEVIPSGDYRLQYTVIPRWYYRALAAGSSGPPPPPPSTRTRNRAAPATRTATAASEADRGARTHGGASPVGVLVFRTLAAPPAPRAARPRARVAAESNESGSLLDASRAQWPSLEGADAEILGEMCRDVERDGRAAHHLLEA